jgi:hypothetical protein
MPAVGISIFWLALSMFTAVINILVVFIQIRGLAD